MTNTETLAAAQPPPKMKPKQRIEALERVIAQTLWMARRYADGRMSYAVSMLNDAVEDAVKLGVQFKPDFADSKDGEIFARDGMADPEAGLFLLSEKHTKMEREYVQRWNEKHGARGNAK